MKKIQVVAYALLAPAAAHAGGILVGESGSQAMERGGAFVAKADDPTALSINPAGLANARNIEVYVGLNLLNFNLDYQRVVAKPIAGEPTSFPAAHNEANWQPVPYLSVVEKIGNLALAEGIYAPQGFPNRDFPCQQSDNCIVAGGGSAPQRYDIIHQESVIAFPSLAAAYRIHPRVDIGARASWGFGTIKARNYTWAVTNHAEDPGFDGDFQASVTDSMIWNFGFGILVRPTDNLEVGASFSTGGQVRGKGTGDAKLGNKLPTLPGLPPAIIEPVPDSDALCDTGGTAAELKSCIDFDLPRKAQLGARWIFRDANGGERGDIELDGRWENHNRDTDVLVTVDGQDSVFHRRLQPTLIRHGFQNVISLRAGGAYKVDLGKNSLTLRGGLAYDSAAAPDSWNRLDIDTRPRQYVTAGVAFSIPGWTFDVGFGVVHEGDVTVARVDNGSPTFDNRSQPDPPQPSFDENQQIFHPINEGNYSSGYVMGMLGITASF